MLEGVCAIVVTYNRCDLLVRCLGAIEKQTLRPQAVIIVDNASDDGTFASLVERGYVAKDLHRNEPFDVSCSEITRHGMTVKYLRAPKNLGGAGGFHLGQLFAYSSGYSWLWLMDDDGLPDHFCLDSLLKTATTRAIPVLNPLVVDERQHDKLSFGLSRDVLSVEDARKAAVSDLVYDLANPFNGTLIHRTVLASVGFIKKEMFIWGDETEYLMRVRRAGFRVATHVESIFFHPASKSSYKRFLGREVVGKPYHLEMNYYRNIGYIDREYHLKLSIPRVILRVVFLWLFFFTRRGVRASMVFLRYYFDGFLNTFSLDNINYKS